MPTLVHRDEALSVLRRAFQQAITSIDLARHRWIKLSATGRSALTACVNCQLRLAHVHGPRWPAAGGGGIVRSGVELRALRQRREAQDSLPPVLDGLDAAVAGMQAATNSMRERLSAACGVLGEVEARNAPLLHTETGPQLLARAEAMLRAYDTERRLRRAMAREIAGDCCGHVSPAEEGETGDAEAGGRLYERAGWESTAKLYLSAWVLSPFLESEVDEIVLESLAAEPMSPTRHR